MTVLTPKEARQIAIGAARSELRSMGKDPATATIDEYENVLDSIERQSPDTVAAAWYRNATPIQWGAFKIEVRVWQKEQRRGR